jgi:hypothetical protein
MSVVTRDHAHLCSGSDAEPIEGMNIEIKPGTGPRLFPVNIFYKRGAGPCASAQITQKKLRTAAKADLDFIEPIMLRLGPPLIMKKQDQY